MSNSLSLQLPPCNAEAFIRWLKQSSTGGSVEPFIKNLNIPKHQERPNTLSLEQFIPIISYPLQSYKITQNQKKEIFSQIARIYPISAKNKESYSKIQNIFKKIIVCPDSEEEARNFVPVDPFTKSFTKEPVDLPFLKSIETRAQGLEEMNQKIERITDVHVKKRGTVTILNLLFFENFIMGKLWKYLEAAENLDRYIEVIQAKEARGRSVIRISNDLNYFIPDLSDDISLETIAIYIRSRNFFDAVLNATKKEKSANISYSDFSQSLEENKEIHLEEENPLIPVGCFLGTLTENRKTELLKLLNQVTEITLYDRDLDCVIPFILSIQHIWSESNDEFTENQINYTCPMRPFSFHQKLYQLCLKYKEEGRTQEKNYNDLYKKYRAIPMANRSHHSDRPNQTISTQLIFTHPELKVTVLPQEFPNIDSLFPAFKFAGEFLQSTEMKKNGFKDQDEKSQESQESIAQNCKPTPKKIKKLKNLEQRPPERLLERLPEKILEEEPSVEIQEPEIAEKITKSWSKSQISPFTYESRVEKWFGVKAPLEASLFSEYTSYSTDYQEKMILFHGFSKGVDQIVYEHGHQFKHENPNTGHMDLCYAIPGEIQTEKETHRGIFYYAQGLGDKIYHRFFSKKKTDELIDIAQNAFYKLDFPEIAPQETSIKIDFLKEDSEESIIQHPGSELIEISNPTTKVKITLIPVK